MSLASYHCSTPGTVSLRRLRLSQCYAVSGGNPLFRGSLAFTAAVALECPRRRKLAELVADHVFRHVQANELPPVVNQERHADEFGNDGAVPRPRLDRLTHVRALVALDFGV